MIALAHTQAKGMTPGKYLRGRPYRRSGSGDVFGRLIRQQPALTSRRQRRHVSSLIEIQLFICSQQNWEFRPLREIVRDWLQSKAVCFSTKQTRCFLKKKRETENKRGLRMGFTFLLISLSFSFVGSGRRYSRLSTRVALISLILLSAPRHDVHGCGKAEATHRPMTYEW